MKWLIASDIHGSAYYCRALLDAFEKEHADRLLLLGDLLYHGPRNDLPRDYQPKEVLRLLNERKDRIMAVRGNCDTEVDQMVLDFPILADYALISLEDRVIFATHGHHFHREALPPLQPGDVLLYGHTHVPLCEWQDGILCCNPGSVSIPKEHSHHGYMTLENATLYWKTLDGDTVRACSLQEEADRS
ncbi:MAG: phosphodiesterase [Eubacterium sp.]|nr:phosphodiesterase [Eubacterium sp.]